MKHSKKAKKDMWIAALIAAGAALLFYFIIYALIFMSLSLTAII